MVNNPSEKIGRMYSSDYFLRSYDPLLGELEVMIAYGLLDGLLSQIIFYDNGEIKHEPRFCKQKLNIKGIKKVWE